MRGGHTCGVVTWTSGVLGTPCTIPNGPGNVKCQMGLRPPCLNETLGVGFFQTLELAKKKQKLSVKQKSI